MKPQTLITVGGLLLMVGTALPWATKYTVISNASRMLLAPRPQKATGF